MKFAPEEQNVSPAENFSIFQGIARYSSIFCILYSFVIKMIVLKKTKKNKLNASAAIGATFFSFAIVE